LAPTPKQAVLLIHGIGFQRPMRTLRGFVEQVWTKRPELRQDAESGHAWSKPDTISKSFELRRLTTVRNLQGVRTDFYEFYWAHLMKGTTLQEVGMWLRALLFRRPSHLPARLVLPWLLLWLATIAVVLAQVNAALDAQHKLWQAWPFVSAVAAVLAYPIVVWLLREFIGDAAVYLDDAPTNIQRRHEIRSLGVTLLKSLHERGYVRIVVVGHSLGSVIGYDVLKYAWAEMHRSVDPAQQGANDALKALEAMLQPGVQFDQATYAGAQAAYLAELQAAGHPWRVTDFVTLGSPLTHAEALLAEDRKALQRKMADRELPTCPPATETVAGVPGGHIWYKGEADGRVVPHHAAPFAVTRWTNLYFPSHWLIHGDFIGGPVAGQFGAGVRDEKVRTSACLGFLAHTKYWMQPAKGDTHIEELSRALMLS